MPRTTDQARVAEAQRLHHLGLTYSAIASQMGVDRSTIRRWLGAQDRPGPRGRADVTDQRLLALRDQGLSYAEIAALTGMSKSGARLRHWSLTGRTRPERERRSPQ